MEESLQFILSLANSSCDECGRREMETFLGSSVSLPYYFSNKTRKGDAIEQKMANNVMTQSKMIGKYRLERIAILEKRRQSFPALSKSQQC